jgi:nicotinic acid phosphoribosyltransferase
MPSCATLVLSLLSVIRGYATTPGIRLNGAKAIAHYEKLGIDPMSKVLVFSDNLDLAKAVELYRHFNPSEPELRDWYPLTCDIPQVKPLNIVIKLVECNGKPVAKLSDSPGKTICHDKAFVRALRKAFDLPRSKKPVKRLREPSWLLFLFISQFFLLTAKFTCLIADGR